MAGSYKKLLMVFGAVVFVLPVLSACSLDEPTKLNNNRVQVQKERFAQEVPAAELDDAALAGMARHYSRYGDGALDLTVTYDPSSRNSTAMSATNEASRIVKGLRDYGVKNVQPNILPVNGQGDQQMALITYTSYKALAPKDCDLLPGMAHTNVHVDEDYKLGCTVETVFAKQIARPRDLKGRAYNSPTTDGRRTANTVEVYRTGVPNEPLGGESSSGE